MSAGPSEASSYIPGGYAHSMQDDETMTHASSIRQPGHLGVVVRPLIHSHSHEDWVGCPLARLRILIVSESGLCIGRGCIKQELLFLTKDTSN